MPGNKFILRRHTQPKEIVETPIGLHDLMMDISREVLREQPNPENLYSFIADYLEALLLARDNAIVLQTEVDNILEFSLMVTDLMDVAMVSMEKAKMGAKIIQKIFQDLDKSHKKFGKAIFVEEDVLFELQSCCDFSKLETYRAKKLLKKFFDLFVEHNVKAKALLYFQHSDKMIDRIGKTLKYYESLCPTEEELNRAAIIIQSAFRGYKVRSRRNLKDLEKKICLIQATFRGFKTRKLLREGIDPTEMDAISCGQFHNDAGGRKKLEIKFTKSLIQLNISSSESFEISSTDSL